MNKAELLESMPKIFRIGFGKSDIIMFCGKAKLKIGHIKITDKDKKNAEFLIECCNDGSWLESEAMEPWPGEGKDEETLEKVALRISEASGLLHKIMDGTFSSGDAEKLLNLIVKITFGD